MNHEIMECDVLIIGAGPAGLSAAIRLGQLSSEAGKTLNIMVMEKGASVGAHILSGCIFEPRALDELLPNWREEDAPIKTAVASDSMKWLTKSGAYGLPIPPMMHNHGNYIISLGRLTQWLAGKAEALGVQIMPGFPIVEPWIEGGILKGGITGAFGLEKDGTHSANYQAPIAISTKYTLIAEGCRGSVAEELIKTFDLRAENQHQTYGLGFKEIWQISESKHKLGHLEHHVGWPLPGDIYGGGFAYHAENNQLYLGMVCGLDYENPHFDPYAAFQNYKTHPNIADLLEGAKRISYGARALNEGGLQSIPGLTFPGGALIGCSAGFLNVPKIKGTHTAMKSGMLAAEAAFAAIEAGRAGDALTDYSAAIKKSWIYKELKAARNIRPSFKWGRMAGMAYSGFEMLLGGKTPWTFKHGKPDHQATSKTQNHKAVPSFTPDNKLTFDKNSSLYLSGTNHREDQPSHLVLKDPSVAIDINWKTYDSPEQRYCPAGVYEIKFEEKNMDTISRSRAQVDEGGSSAALLIHAQNCLHCKTCDIKDITQNIKWHAPEGGGGPNYEGM